MRKFCQFGSSYLSFLILIVREYNFVLGSGSAIGSIRSAIDSVTSKTAAE